MLWQILILGVVAFVSAVGTTSLLCLHAARWGLVDKPDGHRKTHARATPLGGGLAVFIGTVVSLLVGFGLLDRQLVYELEEQLSLGPLAVASLAIVLVGLVDDRWGLRGRHKLAAQIAVALFLVATGFYFQRVGLFGWTFDLGIFALPFVVFWFVGAMNAVNLLDGADGFAGTVGLIMSLGLGWIALASGRLEAALMAFVFAGALLGFLVFNLPPAKIFLGDAGSMLIGLVIGAISIKASLRGVGTLLLAAPLALWAIPIIDVLAAIIRRSLTGRSIYSTDRAHIHHRLLEKLGSNHLLLFVIGAISLVCAGGALGSIVWKSDWMAVLAVGCVLCILVIGDLFGRGELYLLLRALRRAVRPIFGPRDRFLLGEDELAVHIQGSLDWQGLWDEMRRDLQPFGLARVRLDVNIPWLGESFHGLWPGASEELPESDSKRYLVTVPLCVHKQKVGQLSCEGHRNGESDKLLAAQLFDYARVVEQRIGEMIESVQAARTLTSLVRVGSAERGASRGKYPQLVRKFPR